MEEDLGLFHGGLVEDYTQKKKEQACQEIMSEWAKEQGWNHILKK